MAQRLAQRERFSETPKDRDGRKAEIAMERKGLEITGKASAPKALRPSRPAGLEPATCGLEDRYSVRLSYGRKTRFKQFLPCCSRLLRSGVQVIVGYR